MMSVQSEAEVDISKFVVIGDRVLVKPRSFDQQTKSGLYLPPGVQEKEKIQTGFVLKTGPGYAVAPPNEEESWKSVQQSPKYIPLQAEYGDLAIYLSSHSYEIEYEGQKFVIVPQSAILMLIRDF